MGICLQSGTSKKDSKVLIYIKYLHFVYFRQTISRTTGKHHHAPYFAKLCSNSNVIGSWFSFILYYSNNLILSSL